MALPFAVALAGVVSLVVAFISFLIDDKRNRSIVRDIWSAILRIGFASFVSAIVAWGVLRFLNTSISIDYQQPVGVLILEGVVVSGVALVIYVGMVYVMRFPEKEVITLILNKKRRR